MTREEFKSYLLESIERFDNEIDKWEDAPDTLPLEDWLEQFTMFME